MKKFVQLLCILCLTLAGAVQGAEPDAQPAPEGAAQAASEKAKIVVIRSDSLAGSANGANVWINEVLLGNIWMGTTLSGEVDSGKVTIRIKPGGVDMVPISKTIVVDAVAGETNYVFADMTFFGGFKWKALTKEEALPLIEKYKTAALRRKEISDRVKER